jgi:Flp pilus assembly secretin CpaC
MILAASATAHGQESLASAVRAPAPKEYVTVALDLASLVKVPSETATLVVGNPIIADALLPSDSKGLLVLTGRSYGVTNVLALDHDGTPLREMIVKVQQPSGGTVTVLRGTLRETFTCAPRCEQTMTLGDNPEFFNGSNAQIGARNAISGVK